MKNKTVAICSADEMLVRLTSDPRRVYDVKRNGNNRNLPCPCGSGRKFKKCCFYNIPPVTIEL